MTETDSSIPRISDPADGPGGRPQPSRARAWLAKGLRLLVCAAAIAWLMNDPSWRWGELVGVVRSADWRLILLGFLVFGPSPILVSLRLKWLLAVHDIRLTTWEAIKVTFAGNFVIWTLPVGTSGGDAVKAFYIAKDTPKKHEAVSTVVFDRVIGLSSLILLSGVMVLVNLGHPAFEHWGRIIGLVSLAFTVGAAVYFSARLRRLFWFDSIISKLPFAAHLQRLDRAVLAFRHQFPRVAACLALTLVLQATGIVSLFLVGWGLGLVGAKPIETLWVFLAYIPVCWLTGALPIGVMEVTFKELLVDAAGLGTPAMAVSLSLLGRLIQLAWSLPGGIMVLRGLHSRRAEEMLAAVNRNVTTAECDGR